MPPPTKSKTNFKLHPTRSRHKCSAILIEDPHGTSRAQVKLDSAMVFLSKIEGIFTVPTRGCVIVPAEFSNPGVRVKAGDRIQIRNANQHLNVEIASVEWLSRPSGSHLAFLLPKEIELSQIPQEAEIWIE